MTILSITQAESYAKSAGFTGTGLVDILAIAIAESGLNTAATNVNAGPPRSIDRGILQINSVYHSEVTDACAFDPACAFQSGYTISNQGTNFTPWSTWGNGSAAKAIPEVEAAIGSSTGGTSGGSGGTSQQSSGP